jgi:hypothetical protein
LAKNTQAADIKCRGDTPENPTTDLNRDSAVSDFVDVLQTILPQHSSLVLLGYSFDGVIADFAAI